MTPRRTVRGLLALLVLGAGVAAAALRVGLLERAGDVRLSADWALTDFYSAAYGPVRAVLAGGTPYTADSTYPPYAPTHLLLHLPFALLDREPAGIAYFGATVLLTCLLAWLALRLNRARPDLARVLLVAGAVLLSRPGHWTLLLGQVSVLLSCATYLALGAAGSRTWPAAAAVAVTLLKPTFGLPLALLLWAWGRGRTVAIGVALAALVNLPLVALLAAREGGVGELFRAAVGGYRSWQDIGDVNPATSSTRTDVTSLVSRLVGAPLPDAWQVLLAVAILGIAALAVHRLRHRTDPAAEAIATGIVCLAISLVGFHRSYDLVLLTAPALALTGWRTAAALPISPPVRLALLALYAVPALNWIATESVLEAWRPARPAWLLVTSANTVCLLALLLAYVRLAFRTPPAAQAGVGQPRPAAALENRA